MQEPFDLFVQEKAGSGILCTFCNLPNGILRCGHCKAVRYCNQDCQRKDWSASASCHKAHCPVLQVAFAHRQQQKQDLQQLQQLEEQLREPVVDPAKTALLSTALSEEQPVTTTISSAADALESSDAPHSKQPPTPASLTAASTPDNNSTAAAGPVSDVTKHLVCDSNCSTGVAPDSNGTCTPQPNSNGTSKPQPNSNGTCETQPASDTACKTQPDSEVACKPQPELMVDDYRLLEVCFQQSLSPHSCNLNQPQQQRSKATPTRHPTGLINTGNSCFASSTLQCLLATAPLSTFLTSNAHALSCCKPTPTTWCLLCELTSLAQKTHLSRVRDGDPVNPGNITRNIRRLCSR